MRHTVTFDPDVDQGVKRLSKKLGKSFKELINDLLRLGISATERPDEDVPLRLKPVKMGWRGELPDLALLDELEDEERYRWSGS
ncbi:MAG: hypothetical protein WAO58_01640 [Fimbriimonadaceae bacterium]